ncbi:MAG: hypothetical protein KIB40_03530 [Pantoea sp.]|uniref:Uncharacterized protein n=1 Tax=Pantoea brenneri TaxID=472694 RepID=A0AAX3J3X7_9GAMM|nr:MULTISPECIES: hypothetical protein [Pantoea]MBS6032217.1 hypothetical protein [Pantoea sp.]VXB52312.1 conserved hypothetical protein [Pantoea brenneri]
MKNGSEYHYPSSDTYTEKLYSDEGITGLSQNSKIIRLLEELERKGNSIGGARDEVNALFNYVSATKKVKADMITHLEYMKACIEKT